MLSIEVRRLLRNRRTVVVTMVMPVVLFLLFGINKAYAERNGRARQRLGVIMIGIAVYGAMLATTSGGAMVSIERAPGWSRQLRLTPLCPAPTSRSRCSSRCSSACVGRGRLSPVGLATGSQSTPRPGSSPALRLGRLAGVRRVRAVHGLPAADRERHADHQPAWCLRLVGGLFIPLSQYPHALQTLAKFTPLYGLNQLVHAPLLGEGVQWTWAVNALVWLAIFAVGAVWRFRKDTARV